MRVKRLLAAGALAIAMLTGCASGTDNADTAASNSGASASTQSDAGGVLAEYGLGGMDAVEVIDRLDRLGGEDRPADLMASVRPSELVVSAGQQESSLPIPEGKFYLAVAPYVGQTHECFYHSLTTCQGELVTQDVEIEIVDTEGKVLIDEQRTTYENGFVGLWLPRGIEGTVRITHEGKVGEARFATDSEAPTCLTTLQLA